MPDFVNLHTHTEVGSPLDGFAKIDELIAHILVDESSVNATASTFHCTFLFCK